MGRLHPSARCLGSKGDAVPGTGDQATHGVPGALGLGEMIRSVGRKGNAKAHSPLSCTHAVHCANVTDRHTGPYRSRGGCEKERSRLSPLPRAQVPGTHRGRICTCPGWARGAPPATPGSAAANPSAPRCHRLRLFWTSNFPLQKECRTLFHSLILLDPSFCYHNNRLTQRNFVS